MAEESPKLIVRAEMKKRGMTYTDLAQRLNDIGLEVEPKNLANRIGRDSFDAKLFMTCLSAMGIRRINLITPPTAQQGKKTMTDDNPLNRGCPKCRAPAGQPCKRAEKHVGEFHNSRKAAG